MSTLISQSLPSPSSGEIPVRQATRESEVEARHRQVASFLQTHRFDALLIQQPANFAWFTCGGDSTRGGSSATNAALFITREARVVVTNSADADAIFDKQLPALGFQLKQRQWHQPREELVGDLCRGRAVASDTGTGETTDAGPQLTRMRLNLSDLEKRNWRELGRLVAHAAEATARNCRRGDTEAEIAAEVSHRLIKRQVIPERIQICADGRRERFREWTWSGDPVNHFCVINVVGRRNGLHAGVSRTFSFGDPPEGIRAAHYRCALVHAAMMYFSRPGQELSEVWKRFRRIYEKFGFPDEWQNAPQGELLGYAPCEMPVVPASDWPLTDGTAIYWHPSIGPTMVGDSILVREEGYELLTPNEDWPRVTVEVKGQPIARPDILRREVVGLAAIDSDSRFENGDSVLDLDIQTAGTGSREESQESPEADQSGHRVTGDDSTDDSEEWTDSVFG